MRGLLEKPAHGIVLLDCHDLPWAAPPPPSPLPACLSLRKSSRSSQLPATLSGEKLHAVAVAAAADEGDEDDDGDD